LNTDPKENTKKTIPTKFKKVLSEKPTFTHTGSENQGFCFLKPIFISSLLILSSQLRQCLPRASAFVFSYQTFLLVFYFYHVCYMPANLTLLDYSAQIIPDEDQISCSSS